MENVFESLGKILKPEQSKHTPGEWIFKEYHPKLKGPVVLSESGLLICEINSIGDGTVNPNGELIASAPALLEENKKLKEIIGELGSAIQDAYATIIRWRESNPEQWDERDDLTLAAIEKAKHINQ